MQELDPALLAIIGNRLETIVREMINAILRTARSGVLNTARDLSCAILTADNRLLAFADSIPIHVAAISLEGEWMTRLHVGTLQPGDAFLNNSPYHGGTHHADHTVLVPVFWGDELVATVCAKAHQADVGNARATTYSPTPRDLYEEGALNLPCVRVQRNYRDVDDIIRICKTRIRVPEQWYGDYLGALGAARIGERRLLELLTVYGRQRIDQFVEEWFDYSERRMRGEIRTLPAGTWTAETRHDPFPGVPDGIPIRVLVQIDPENERVQIDLRDNIDSVPCGLNLSAATATSAALIGFYNGLRPGVPLNEGALRRLTVAIRENCVVGNTTHPRSCSVATTNVADRLVNAVTVAMAQIRPDYCQAEGGLGIPASRAVISGHDSRRDGSPYVNQIFLGTAGGPASSDCDGWIPYFSPVSGGRCYRDSVEIDEQKYPVIVDRLELLMDSGGAGRFRGAPGTLVEYGPASTDGMLAIYASDGHLLPAAGVHGGLSGSAAEVARIDASGVVHALPQVGEIQLEPGERLRVRSCGGGGYGDPRQRPRSDVAEDLAEGYVSSTAAVHLYGLAAASDPMVASEG